MQLGKEHGDDLVDDAVDEVLQEKGIVSSVGREKAANERTHLVEPAVLEDGEEAAGALLGVLAADEVCGDVCRASSERNISKKTSRGGSRQGERTDLA